MVADDCRYDIAVQIRGNLDDPLLGRLGLGASEPPLINPGHDQIFGQRITRLSALLQGCFQINQPNLGAKVDWLVEAPAQKLVG